MPPETNDPIRDIAYGIAGTARAVEAVADVNQRDHRHVLTAVLDLTAEVQRLQAEVQRIPNEVQAVILETERRLLAATPPSGVPTLPLQAQESAKLIAAELHRQERDQIALPKNDSGGIAIWIKKSWLNSAGFKCLIAAGGGALLLRLLEVLKVLP